MRVGWTRDVTRPPEQMISVSEAAWGSREHPAPEEEFRECEAIGVARDASLQFGEDNLRQLYLPFALESAVQAPGFMRPRNAALRGHRAVRLLAASAASGASRFDGVVAGGVACRALLHFPSRLQNVFALREITRRSGA